MADTNILISALLKEGVTRTLLDGLKEQVLIPTYALQESVKHLPGLAERMRIPLEVLHELLILLAEEHPLIPQADIEPWLAKAREAMEGIDLDDAFLVAAALAADAAIWSDDNHVKRQTLVTTYTTAELLHVAGCG